MASLGTFLLLAAFVVCSYAAGVSITGARRRSRRLIESGIGAFYLVTALMTVASAVIVNAFLTDDFTIRYVAHYSDSVQPLFYKITSYWGGLDGSIMFWVFLLSVFGSTAVYVNRERHRELIPYVVAVISIVQMFFLFLMVVHNNPFATFITNSPADGNGLNPALQSYWMVIHPPSLYTGFVGMTIPFAFGMAALITGHLDDAWLRAVRRWTMVAWLFLTFGLMLGMIWAYEELGWGGYWAWDPVENAALLPWFTATAFLHSVMVQERRSMLRVWNVTLVIVTFFLTIFGTFMTRSGVVSSVHAFGEDSKLAWMFTVFMVAIIIVSFGFVIYRLPLLRARNTLDSWASREAAFLVNNWILLFCAFFVLFATMFPTLSEAVTGERITVGPPFFNKWMLPIGLTLLFLTGIGPLLAWRKSSVRNLAQSFLWPVAACIVTLVTVGRYTLRHDALKVAEDDQKQMVTAYISVFEGGKQIDTLYPSKWFYRKHEGQPTTETAIRRRPSEDLYVVLAKPEIESQTAFLEIHVNPLVNWVWFGFGVIAIGTGIALLPERAFSFALARLPADAATTTAALLLAVLLSATTLAAQSGSGAEKVQVANITPLERQMQGEILCMCGGCKSPLNDCPMLYCHMREPEKAILHDLVEEGRTHDQIVASFIQRYGGQDELRAPLHHGIYSLALLFPHLVGARTALP